MKAVMAVIPDHVLEWRKKTGAERWDEMWEGVLHMPPMPTRGHQYLEWSLETWLRLNWARPQGHQVYHNVNLASPGGWPEDYRIPDLLLLTPARFHTDHDVYFEGAPDAVVEIRSPDDETYEKMGWSARLGVPEVWIIQRDTKQPEVHELLQGRYEPKQPDADGWIASALGIEMRSRTRGRLAIRLTAAPDAISELPD